MIHDVMFKLDMQIHLLSCWMKIICKNVYFLGGPLQEPQMSDNILKICIEKNIT
jgi:hypothetical protein